MDRYLERFYELERRLHEDALWLVVQAERPVSQFVQVAYLIDLRQQDWDIFWKKLREGKSREEKNIECLIGGKEYRFTEKEFEVAKQILNCSEPEEISNCCDAEVEPHRAGNHFSVCTDCKEGCGIVYVF